MDAEQEWGRSVFASMTALTRAIEALHAGEWVQRASGVALDRALHPVVASVGERGSARISDIARDLGLTVPTVSRHVAQLLERGLLERVSTTADRRTTVVRLSARGRAVRSQLRRAWVDILGLATQDWADDERRAFEDLFARFAQGLRTAQPGRNGRGRVVRVEHGDSAQA
ncbi:MarR family winged helix-turn-helix transcriptional regulator [Pseudonocardia sulfidoxydans]|nr:MarR family winged helix-turn-helix transcriptional regulator [Pseudonocardia sulfidoxydans]